MSGLGYNRGMGAGNTHPLIHTTERSSYGTDTRIPKRVPRLQS